LAYLGLGGLWKLPYGPYQKKKLRSGNIYEEDKRYILLSISSFFTNDKKGIFFYQFHLFSPINIIDKKGIFFYQFHLFSPIIDIMGWQKGIFLYLWQNAPNA
jgi:hypothetical protein